MHYHFDTTDETLKAWTLGLGSHPLPWEVIRKSVKEDSVSFRSLAKRKIIKECWKTGRPFYYIDTGYVGNLIKKKIFFYKCDLNENYIRSLSKIMRIPLLYQN